jgi:hypothetical protein
MSNWINHVKNYAIEHNIPYKQALIEAKNSYVKNDILTGRGQTNKTKSKKPSIKKYLDIPSHPINPIWKNREEEVWNEHILANRPWRIHIEMYEKKYKEFDKENKKKLSDYLNSLDSETWDSYLSFRRQADKEEKEKKKILREIMKKK